MRIRLRIDLRRVRIGGYVGVRGDLRMVRGGVRVWPCGLVRRGAHVLDYSLAAGAARLEHNGAVPLPSSKRPLRAGALPAEQ